jgi:hypothetical protein
MEEKAYQVQESQAAGDSISRHLAKITELKESLKHARGIPEEMSLLTDLTSEISALRKLLEPRYHI